MKRLLVLWDPENPLTPVGSILSALRSSTEISECTFRDVSHRTMPNRAFEIAPIVDRLTADALLWVEGGPLPGDLEKAPCPKACWLLNAHHEPTLLEDLAPAFDRTLIANLGLSAEEKARWVPLAALPGAPPAAPPGLSILFDDPRPPAHVAIEHKLREVIATPSRPIVFCLGQQGQLHPRLFDAMRSGAAVVVDPECDLRGIAHVGEHLEVFPSLEGLRKFTEELAADAPRLDRLASRGPEIVDHLHTAALRAAQLRDALWPSEVVLGGGQAKPLVSVLVTCYRYLKRFRFCLESLARQDLPPGSVEVVVADPGSPDGLVEFLADFARRNLQIRLVRLPMDPRYHRNRGVGINRTFDASSGEFLVSIDGDLVFPPHLLRVLVEEIRRTPGQVFGIRRSFLTREVTEQILAGQIDPFGRFEELSRSEGDGEEKPFVGVLGYCQATHRKAFARARYPEEFDMVNQSDIVFVERLGRSCSIRPKFLEEHTALHLWHPRNWKGTSEFL